MQKNIYNVTKVLLNQLKLEVGPRRRAALRLDPLWPFMSRNYRDKLNNYKMAIGHIHGPYKMMIGSKGEKGPLICDQKQNVTPILGMSLKKRVPSFQGI